MCKKTIDFFFYSQNKCLVKWVQFITFTVSSFSATLLFFFSFHKINILIKIKTEIHRERRKKKRRTKWIIECTLNCNETYLPPQKAKYISNTVTLTTTEEKNLKKHTRDGKLKWYFETASINCTPFNYKNFDEILNA